MTTRRLPARSVSSASRVVALIGSAIAIAAASFPSMAT
jgi:hypothetical protein